jgi:hypothetical protein
MRTNQVHIAYSVGGSGSFAPAGPMWNKEQDDGAG